MDEKTASFYSQASNSVSSIQGGVDPRTGLFNINLPLINLQTNNLLGPELSLSLNYSPLSALNNGFGIGVTLGLSYYDTTNGTLSLSTGEEYRVNREGNTVKQKKLNNFLFKKIDNGTYQIIYKSGVIEQLTLRKEIYVTSRITAPDGRGLQLTWNSEYKRARLTQITDDTGTLLLSITYPDEIIATTEFTILPQHSQIGYSIIFKFINGRLVKVTSQATSPSLTWLFEYNDVGYQKNYRVITDILSPTGKIERVRYYSDIGMAFPDIANQPELPCVYQHFIIPNAEQPSILTEWEWTKKNYLGKDAGLNQWQPDTDQMLNILLGDYQYGSVAKLLDTDKMTVLSKITRRYNSYHLLVSESVWRAGKTYTQSTEYYAKPRVNFDEQPAQYALAKRKKEHWFEHDDLSTRSQETSFDFDDQGNLLRQELPDGTVTEYVYYAADGEGVDCPPDPHGFKRYTKTETIIPRKVTGDEPQKITHFTWQRQNTLNNKNYFLVQNSAQEIVGLSKTLTLSTYYNDRLEPLLFGRKKKETILKTPNIVTNDTFIQSNSFIYDLQDRNLKQITTSIGYDGLTTSQSTVRHVNTNNLLIETDIQGITNSYIYDRLNRLLKQTTAPNTKYERTIRWEFAIEDKGPTTIEITMSGERKKILFDGLGREISHFIFDKQDSQRWYEIRTFHYNAFDDIYQTENHDFLISSSKTKSYTLKNVALYDGWGAVNTLFSLSDTLVNYREVDPIKLTEITHNQGQSKNIVINGGKFKTEFNPINKLPQSKQRLDEYGNVIACRQYFWDGLERLYLEIDESGHEIKRTYDIYNRVLTQTLSDGTVITRTYAPHLTGDEIASISVTGKDASGNIKCWLLGTQAFDSLGRLIQQNSGGRLTTYQYEGASPVPEMITLPSGDSIKYAYIPQWDNAIHSLTADGINQAFNYDNSMGYLLLANENGAENRNTWSTSGQLQTESFTSNEKTRHAAYTWTLGGEPVSYTDISGKQTVYNRDEYGRVINITDDRLTVDISYDGLNRLTSQRIKDNHSDLMIMTVLEYDDFNQEITRTITDNNDSKLTISQIWLKTGLLSIRTTKQNDLIIRTEKYHYDSRNRLIYYRAAGTHLSSDAYDHQITEQIYAYDCLNNLTSVISLFNNDSYDTATYEYHNSDDPTQLSRVLHTHRLYPKIVPLEYDANGRMTLDNAGQRLSYDAIGRLSGTNNDSYQYNALNQLIGQQMGEHELHQLYYRGSELVNEVLLQQNSTTRFIKWNHNCLGVSDENQLTLTARDQHDSLLLSLNHHQEKGQTYAWTPYGYGETEENLLGFNGERTDPISGAYHLGNGYRAYNPILMRFNCPDNQSPFGAGGINSYVYCASDPINNIDPSGHISTQGTIGIITGIIGIGLAAVSFGSSLAAAGVVMASVTLTLSVASEVTGIASIIVEESNPKASSILGWTSLALGVASVGTGMTNIKRITAKTEDIALTPSLSRRSSLGQEINNVAEHRGERLIGYHGTSRERANNIVRTQHFIGQTYLTDSYEIAARYANLNGENGVVLGVYLREGVREDNLKFFNTRVNGRGFRETIMHPIGEDAISIRAVDQTAPNSRFSIVENNPLTNLNALLSRDTRRHYRQTSRSLPSRLRRFCSIQ